MENNLVFVYGTLKKGHGNYERTGLDKTHFVGVGTIQGRIYSLGGFPGLKEHPSDRVHGEVYAVDAETLSRLDRLEGHPRMYERKVVDVATNNIAELGELTAWAYFYNGNVDNRHFIRSGVW